MIATPLLRRRHARVQRNCPRGGWEPGGGPAVYRQLATMMKFDFIRCVGASDERAQIENDHLPLEAFTVDPGAFAEALDRLH